jgi:hypothetical protein
MNGDLRVENKSARPTPVPPLGPKIRDLFSHAIRLRPTNETERRLRASTPPMMTQTASDFFDQANLRGSAFPDRLNLFSFDKTDVTAAFHTRDLYF